MLKLPQIYHYFLLFGLILGLISPSFAQPISNTASSLPSVTAPTNEYILSGRWLYCVTQGSGKNTETHLIMSSIDGTQSKVLYSVRGQIFALNASFNPRYVTFTANTYNNYPTAYLLDLQTSHIRVLTPYRANNLGASIAPDGNHFLFSSDLDDNIEIYQNILNPTSSYRSGIENHKPDSHLLRLTNDPNADISPSFTRDGQSFIFVSDRKGRMQPQIYQYDLTTGITTWLDTQNDYATEPKFNPNGDKITLLNRSKGVIYDLKTKESRKITTDDMYAAPTFSPDGKFISYSTGQNIVIIPEARIWEKPQLDDTDKIIITPILPRNVTGTLRRPTWLP